MRDDSNELKRFAPESQKQIRWIYLIAALLSLIGLADLPHLTVQHLTARVCAAQYLRLFRVLSSPYAQIGSIPCGRRRYAYFSVFVWQSWRVSLSIRTATAGGAGGVMLLMTLWLPIAGLRDSTLLPVLPDLSRGHNHPDGLLVIAPVVPGSATVSR